MLIIVQSMRELAFGRLMEVYQEPSGLVSLRAEQEFYHYLNDCFFRTPGAVYCIWQEGQRYVSALRLEPYNDGRLLTALQTAPDCRGNGYAGSLVRAVLAWQKAYGGGKIYSHIENRNAPSIAVHVECGFRKISDHAVYLDGSVDCRSGTYIYEC